MNRIKQSTWDKLVKGLRAYSKDTRPAQTITTNVRTARCLVVNVNINAFKP